MNYVGTIHGVNKIIGQDQAISVLQRSLRGDRRHHAWVFSGNRGIGKYTTAVQYAGEILGVDFTKRKSHADLHVIRKEDVVWSQNPSLQRKKQTNIPLDLLRERMIGGKTSDDRTHDAAAYKTPSLGKEKVFIIDEAELLDETAQNALLKTIEEPPAGTTIVLVTCRDDLLLPTVRSRCQTLSFSPLDDASMSRWSETLGEDVGASALAWAIGFSCGSPGLATRALDAGLPTLVDALAPFLEHRSSNHVAAAESIISFVDDHVQKTLKDNPLGSKDAANRVFAELVLLVFGSAAQLMILGEHPEDGVAAAGILADVERQFSTNISMKVLLESLTSRWVHTCAGDGVFV